jgi:7-cyano-7-deazaguanine reductase
MTNLNFLLTQVFGFKKLRKANHKCEYTGCTLCYEKGDFSIHSTYDIQQIFSYIDGNIELLLWIFDRMWEDWLTIYSKDKEAEIKLESQNLDQHAKNIINKVTQNVKTPLGTRTAYIDKYDSSLLLPVKRQPTREAIGYEYIPFVGLDIWNGYELSYLDKNGKPQNRIIQLAYDSDSESIIESKSLKLYFNSFNNTRISDKEIVDIISSDLSAAIKTNVLKIAFVNTIQQNIPQLHYTLVDDLYCEDYLYAYDPEILNIKPALERRPIYLKSNILKSNCRHSGLPDWGTAYISYMPNACVVEESSLLQYIISYRNHREFHEECCERILHDIMFKLKPQWLRVELKYSRRGGLDINPIRIYDSVGLYCYDFYTELSNFFREIRQ